MERKFFWRRFRNYLFLLIAPTLVVFAIWCAMTGTQLDQELDARAENTLKNVNTNLDFVISGVIFQNDQLTNNSYMVLSLKKLLRRETNIQYADAIYMRNIRTMMSSIIQSYPYIQSVNLYLDGYDNYFSSGNGVTALKDGENINWCYDYFSEHKETDKIVQSNAAETTGKERATLTVYQKMLLLDGIVVMNIDIEKYRQLLDEVLVRDDEMLLYYNREQELLFTWNDLLNKKANEAVREANFLQNVIRQKEDKWISLGGERYLVHSRDNPDYELSMVSLISYQAKLQKMSAMAKPFAVIFCLNFLAVAGLAYASSKRSFERLHHMVQVFSDAESGKYPTEPRAIMENEYDVILNNIIYLFLQTMHLNSSLTEKQHEQEVAELTALQLQINPHFLFNTLQNVQMEVKKLEGNTERVNRILDDLSDILKYALADSQEQISLREEIQYLKKYVSIQAYRFDERFIVYYEIDDELMDFPVFRLMLQPLVENSILHGIRPGGQRGYIKIQVFARKNKVHFRVVDNGVGMTGKEQEQLLESIETINVHHIGLANVNRRLKLYYGEEAGITIKSRPGWGCVMEFVIPRSGGQEMRIKDKL